MSKSGAEIIKELAESHAALQKAKECLYYTPMDHTGPVVSVINAQQDVLWRWMDVYKQAEKNGK